MASGSDTNGQFNIPDPSTNFYHTIDLHNHQRTDVASHFHRQQHQQESTTNPTKSSNHHSKKWTERAQLISAVHRGDTNFVRAFIQDHRFLQPHDADSDINRYFVHRSHHHPQTSQNQHTVFRRSDTAANERTCESSDEEELDLAGETESSNTGLNILCIAALAGKFEIIQELLKIPNIATEATDNSISGCTPLLIAAKHHDADTVRVLLEDEKHNPTGKRRVDKAAVCKSQDHFAGFSALMLACHEYGIQASKAKFLKQMPSNDNNEKNNHSSAKQLSDVELLTAQLRTIREILLHAGFDIDHESNDERRALFVACGHCADARVIDVLINAGAKFSFALNGLRGATRFDGGSWPIHECVKFARLTSLKTLLSHIPQTEKRRIEVNLAFGTYHMTPLLLAVGGASSSAEESSVVDGGDEERVHLLSDKEEMKLDQREREQRHQGRIASRRKIYFDIVKLLVESGADVSARGGLRNEMAIETAKREGHAEMAQFLAGHCHDSGSRSHLVHLDKIESGNYHPEEDDSPTQRIEGGGVVGANARTNANKNNNNQREGQKVETRNYNSDVTKELAAEMKKQGIRNDLKYYSDSSTDEDGED